MVETGTNGKCETISDGISSSSSELMMAGIQAIIEEHCRVQRDTGNHSPNHVDTGGSSSLEIVPNIDSNIDPSFDQILSQNMMPLIQSSAQCDTSAQVKEQDTGVNVDNSKDFSNNTIGNCVKFININSEILRKCSKCKKQFSQAVVNDKELVPKKKKIYKLCSKCREKERVKHRIKYKSKIKSIGICSDCDAPISFFINNVNSNSDGDSSNITNYIDIVNYMNSHPSYSNHIHSNISGQTFESQNDDKIADNTNRETNNKNDMKNDSIHNNEGKDGRNNDKSNYNYNFNQSQNPNESNNGNFSVTDNYKYSLCPLCRLKSRLKKAKRAETGKCTNCCKNNDTPNYKSCTKCRNYFKKRKEELEKNGACNRCGRALASNNEQDNNNKQQNDSRSNKKLKRHYKTCTICRSNNKRNRKLPDEMKKRNKLIVENKEIQKKIDNYKSQKLKEKQIKKELNSLKKTKSQLSQNINDDDIENIDKANNQSLGFIRIEDSLNSIVVHSGFDHNNSAQASERDELSTKIISFINKLTPEMKEAVSKNLQK
ncbi:uncharacterized protein ASCRUDRAFT_8486 [Ascoidea rubescens DSM 1968]|uniref:Stc1 domain-containing protein n=1 Tax=Ascoidea rubescens DSM 1968 TaxID=1344418 RepID=A0A1D2VHD1_9ASCO|nr:hypothetical protein ASCRUDRAFT_8486 [Ascoidea rubescens DSM 1968]ODV60913.1 hypothetical protein ASCRUDRAFT_8486 [Ascoidea rubescens DSM 1968]